MGDVGFVLAFFAGAVSFLSPCVLALAPGYVFMLSGMTDGGRDAGGSGRLSTLYGALAFILGFSLVFITLGAAASGAGQLLRSNRELMGWIGGTLIIIFGIQVTGLVKIPFMLRQFTPIEGGKGTGFWGCLITGVSFAFGWTPCVGPILGSILTLAGRSGGFNQGLALLVVYSLGFSVPFLVTALFIDRIKPLVARILRVSGRIELVSGIVLIITGILVITDGFYLITSNLLSMMGSWTPDDIAERLSGLFTGK